MSYVDNWLTTVAELLFPPHCLGCRGLGAAICESCREEIDYLGGQNCLICGGPTLDGQTHPRCGVSGDPSRVISIFVYRGVIRRALVSAKYGPKNFAVYTDLVDLAVDYLDELGVSLSGALLAPIPSFWRRGRQRGFNPAEIIAKLLGERLGLEVRSDLLRRVDLVSVPQSKLSRRERQRRLQGVFRLSAGADKVISGRDLWLVDDVLTTGATLREAARTVNQLAKPFKPRQLAGLTLARG